MAAFWTDCYQAHFQRFFNKPFDVQIFHSDGLALKVATYDRPLQNYRVLASLGLADKLVADDEDDFGEVILLTDVPDREVPHLFVNALFFILQKNIPVGSRFAIGGIDGIHEPFTRRYGKSALYFTLAHDESENFNRVRNGDEFGCVYQALFISAAEDRYLDEYGPDELEKKLRAQEGERESIRRPSVV